MRALFCCQMSNDAFEVLQLCFEHIRFLSQNSLLFSLDLLEEEVTRFGLLSQ